MKRLKVLCKWQSGKLAEMRDAMGLAQFNPGDLVLLGGGKMGFALLSGWLDHGLHSACVTVLDPYPSDMLKAIKGLRLNAPLPPKAAVCVLAVKPQMMADALPQVQALADGKCLFISVAAGTTLHAFGRMLGSGQKIIRVMPNTPAAIGRGISAIIGNEQCSISDIRMAGQLLDVVGQTVFLDNESQLDAVTGLSGSGPAYVFHMIETMAAAGVKQGLSAELSMQLAIQTVAGAGALAAQSADNPEQLRINVTSPNGTTQAGLSVLMGDDALMRLIERTVAAASDRSRELAKND